MQVDSSGSGEIRYFTQQEVADRFRVSPSTVKNWRDQGKIGYFQPDGSSRVLYPVEAIEEFERRFRVSSRNGEPRKPAEKKKGKPGMSFKPQKEWRI